MKPTSLHATSLVIDTQAPRINCDLLLTDAMARELFNLTRKGLSPRDARVALARLLVNEMRGSEKVIAQYKAILEATGVTISNTTQLGAIQPSLGFSEAIEMVSSTRGLIDLLSPDLQLVTCADDIRRIHRKGAHGVLMNLQNSDAFGDILDRIELFYNLGIRIVQLTYNRSNLVGGGCTDAGGSGLTYFGKEVVRLLNEYNIMIDVSHCNEQTTWDAMKVSRQPVSFTHTSAYNVHPHDRAKKDDQISAIAKEGGFVGVLLVASFIQPHTDGDLSDFLRHIEHIANLVGTENVGIGTDTGRCYEWPAQLSDVAAHHDLQTRYARHFDWVGWRPEHRLGQDISIRGFSQWTDWPNITAALSASGLSDDEVRGLLGENFLRIFEEIVG